MVGLRSPLRRVWLLAALSACTAVDDDLLGPHASPCDLGEPGAWIDITPPVVPMGVDPGVRAIAMDPFDPSVIYAATHGQGIWRSADCGASWVHTNTGINGPVIENALTIDLALDPFVPDTVYVTPRFGGGSVWVSYNAGVHWENLIPADVAMPLYASDLADLSHVYTLRDQPHHLLVSSMVAWVGETENAGLLEGLKVGDAWHWTVHPPAPAMGVQQSMDVLDDGTWMITSSYVPAGEGTWISRDHGATFTKLDDRESAGRAALHRSPDGTLYRPAYDGLLRSTDGGATWTDVFVGLGFGGSQAVTSDGANLLVSSAVPDGPETLRLYTAPERPGDRGWSMTGAPSDHSVQRFLRDPTRGVLYAFNGFTGIQRIRLR